MSLWVNMNWYIFFSLLLFPSSRSLPRRLSLPLLSSSVCQLHFTVTDTNANIKMPFHSNRLKDLVYFTHSTKLNIYDPCFMVLHGITPSAQSATRNAICKRQACFKIHWTLVTIPGLWMAVNSLCSILEDALTFTVKFLD